MEYVAYQFCKVSVEFKIYEFKRTLAVLLSSSLIG